MSSCSSSCFLLASFSVCSAIKICSSRLFFSSTFCFSSYRPCSCFRSLRLSVGSCPDTPTVTAGFVASSTRWPSLVTVPVTPADTDMLLVFPTGEDTSTLYWVGMAEDPESNLVLVPALTFPFSPMGLVYDVFTVVLLSPVGML